MCYVCQFILIFIIDALCLYEYYHSLKYICFLRGLNSLKVLIEEKLNEKCWQTRADNIHIT